MKNFFSVLKALFGGYLTGFVISIPLGPASIESVKRTVSKGFKEGFTVSIGALSADLTYFLLINFGLFNILHRNGKTESLFWIISGIILSFIGYKSIVSKNSDSATNIPINYRFKSIPYITGYMITFTNPMTPTLWLTLSGTVLSFWLYISKACYYTFLISLGAGMVTWYVLLNYLALKGFKFLTPKASKHTTFLLMLSILVIGIGFIVFGIIRLILKL